MTKTLLALPGLLFVFALQANTYYSVNNTAPNVAGNWHVNRNGTGASPANFTSGDMFVIQSGQSLTTSANWTVTGANAKILIETGATLQADNKVAVPNFEIDGTGTYIHNASTNSFPGSTTISLAATSTVEVRNWNGSAALPSPTTWGNLIINVVGFGSNINQAGGLTDVAGDLDIRNTGSGANEFRLSTTQNYSLTIGGNLIIEAGVLEAGQNNGNHTQSITINGSYIQSGGTFTRTNNNANTLKVQFNGSNSNFTMTGGTLTDTYMDWTVNASKKLTLSNNLSIAASRSLTVNGTLDCGTHQVTGAGSFTLASTGDIITASSLGVNGSVTVAGMANYTNGASYEFHAATTTPFATGGGAVSASNVVIYSNVTLNKDVSVSTSLNLSGGQLAVPPGNTITVASGSVITGSPFGISNHIVTQVNTSTGAKGVVHVSNLNGTATFPIGNGTYYMPVTLTTSSANDFSLTVFQGITQNGTPNGTVFTAPQKIKLVDAVWIINRNSGVNGVTMQLSWPSALEGSVFQTLADNEIGIAHYSTYWESPLGSGSQSLNTVTRTNITTFSPFGIGKIGEPLPLIFGDIKVSEKNSGVLNIDWITYDETNLAVFKVDRSLDGHQFKTVGTVTARNSHSKENYSWTDNSPLAGISFYRLEAVDIDGVPDYSNVVRANLAVTNNSRFTIYPNPVAGTRVSVQLENLDKGKYRLSISDITGKIIYNQYLDHTGGILSQTIQLPSFFSRGIYAVSLCGDSSKFFSQLIVK